MFAYRCKPYDCTGTRKNSIHFTLERYGGLAMRVENWINDQ